MFMVLKKKYLLIATLIIMVAVAGYLNYRYDNNPNTDVLKVDETEPEIGETTQVNANVKQDEKNDSDYFASYRLDREKSRAKTKEDLEKIVNNPSSSAEAKQNAEKQLSEIAKAISTETSAETVLKSKGFEDVVVYINNDSVNVTIRSDGLSTSDTAKIIDAVYELTKNNNIKIVEVE